MKDVVKGSKVGGMLSDAALCSPVDANLFGSSAVKHSITRNVSRSHNSEVISKDDE